MKNKVLILLMLLMALFLASCGEKPAESAAKEGTAGAKDEVTAEAGTKDEVKAESEAKKDEIDAETGATAKGKEGGNGATAGAEKTSVRLGGLKGPTTMGAVKLLEDAKTGVSANSYEFTMATSGDELVPLITQGKLDIALLPSNLASVLYQKTGGKVQVISTSVLGVLSIVEKGETVKELADLKGKTIMAVGKGTVPEMTLRILLKAGGIDPDSDVTIDWKSEPNEIVAALAQEGEIALLPQPFVTVAMTKVDGLKEVINISDEWEKVKQFPIVTGVAVVNKEFAEKNKEAVDNFLAEYKTSIEYVNANTEEAAALIETYDIVKAPIAKEAIAACNLSFKEGSEMKDAVSKFLMEIHSEEPKAVGGTLPGDDFYYEK